ncbi:uncharacterized protein ARMOST_11548 [Armillaria ostoyae]|uniref:Uncharacterized protein n=1 Tax=Armillaria ostoyae TaxID=47428 RepID=A0A284RHF0_ARMOS|nr:uncharacterized protein ARMOST_11548 [Armillaria ostoyae]
MSSSKPAERTKRDPRYPYADISLRAASTLNLNLYKVLCFGNQDPWNNQDSGSLVPPGRIIVDYTLNLVVQPFSKVGWDVLHWADTSAILSLQCSPNTSFSLGLGLRQDDGRSSEREAASDHVKGWPFATRRDEESILGKDFTVQFTLTKFLSPHPGLTFPSPREREYVEPAPRF